MQNELYYKKEEKKFSPLKFFICVVGTLALAYLSSFLSKLNRGFSFIVPEWTTDFKLSMVIWISLAILAGLSLYLALQSNSDYPHQKKLKATYVVLWLVQAVFAFVWPISIFTYQKLIFSFVWIAILDGIVASLIVLAFRLRWTSGLVLIPYFALLLGMSYFNLTTIMLN